MTAEFRAHKPLEHRSGDELEPVAKVLRELSANVPWLHARRLAIVFDGVSLTADVRHGLGRAYTGGWIGDTVDSSRRRAVITGSVAAAAGLDTSTYVRVTQSATAAETVYVWVF